MADAAAAAVGALVSVIETKLTRQAHLIWHLHQMKSESDIAALQDNFKTELTDGEIPTGAIDALEDEIGRSISVVNSASMKFLMIPI